VNKLSKQEILKVVTDWSNSNLVISLYSENKEIVYNFNAKNIYWKQEDNYFVFNEVLTDFDFKRKIYGHFLLLNNEILLDGVFDDGPYNIVDRRDKIRIIIKLKIGECK